MQFRVRARYAQFFSRSNRLLVSHFDSLAEGPLSRPYLSRPSFDFGQVRQRRNEESLYIPLCVFFALVVSPNRANSRTGRRHLGHADSIWWRKRNSQKRHPCCTTEFAFAFRLFFCFYFRRPPKKLHKHNLGVYVNVRIFCACPCWKRITGPHYGHAC